MTSIYNNGSFTVTYSYDAVTGLPIRVTDDLTNSRMDFSFDEDRMPIGTIRQNGVNTIYMYDNAGRLIRIRDGSITDLQYTLDAAGQVSSVNMTVPLDPGPLLSSGAHELSFDGASQVSTEGYSYDARGRLTASPGNTFTWNGASHLVGVNSTTLAYNGLGDLAARNSTRLYDNYAIGLKPIAAEKNDTAGEFLRCYVWTPNGSVLYMIDAADGNKVYYYHFDRTGSTLALTDSTGAVTDSYAYDPYGKLLQHQGESVQSFTFVGMWGVRHEATFASLYQMRARYDDTETKRFLSRDPIWPNIGEPRELNPYQYALADPVNMVDLTGLDLTAAVADGSGLVNPDLPLFVDAAGGEMTPGQLMAAAVDEVLSDTATSIERDAAGTVVMGSRSLGDVVVPALIRQVATTSEPDGVVMSPGGDLVVIRSGSAATLVPAAADTGSFQTALAGIQKAVYGFLLPFIHRGLGVALPESGLGQNVSDQFSGFFRCAAMTPQKPLKPFGDVTVPFLASSVPRCISLHPLNRFIRKGRFQRAA